MYAQWDKFSYLHYDLVELFLQVVVQMRLNRKNLVDLDCLVAVDVAVCRRLFLDYPTHFHLLDLDSIVFFFVFRKFIRNGMHIEIKMNFFLPKVFHFGLDFHLFHVVGSYSCNTNVYRIIHNLIVYFYFNRFKMW